MEEVTSKSMTIGALAKEAGVGVETVRFYQRKGLLETPQRTAGFRKYSDDDVRKIKFVKKVQELGFSLKDAQELLELSTCCAKTRPKLVEVCEEKRAHIQAKIQDLSQMLGLLQKFSQICGKDASINSECSLLDCFENDWECCKNTKEG